MKKLVMMLALALAVFSAKAAYVNWSVTAAAELNGYTAYLLASAPAEYADVGELAAAAVGSATIVKSGRSYGTGDQLSLCAWTGNPCGNHGRQRHGRKERYSI